ncbi:unnamed protein product [Notodromas monacha]|uniref:Ubiquinol-cytochrome C reductase hinge domain-containing protein n=1 Tax=Notodromas monacha TaxID=399045 RepID=A0A7R9GJ63_9CRUS|nr:unnamed protein product [Notodromas monacha]CAG0923196.1 unnamed protein product [Notodromas monacha]
MFFADDIFIRLELSPPERRVKTAPVASNRIKFENDVSGGGSYETHYADEGRCLGPHWKRVRLLSQKEDDSAERNGDETKEDKNDGGDGNGDEDSDEEESKTVEPPPLPPPPPVEEEKKEEAEDEPPPAKEEKKEVKDEGGNGDGGGEDGEMSDPLERLKGECEANKKCVALKARLEECNDRVNSCEGETTETCEEEIMDFIHCIDHCVAKDLFKYVK